MAPGPRGQGSNRLPKSQTDRQAATTDSPYRSTGTAFPSKRPADHAVACNASLPPSRVQVVLADFGDREPATDLACQLVGDLRVSGHGFHFSRSGIRPKRVRPAFSLQYASVPAQVFQPGRPFHPSETTSLMASAGTPRKPTSSRSSRINSIASAKLYLASSLVRPCGRSDDPRVFRLSGQATFDGEPVP